MSYRNPNDSSASSGSNTTGGMKRMMAGGYNKDGGDKRQRNMEGGGGLQQQQQQIGPMDHNKECRVLIPSKHAGAVIGKGGDVIKRLRSEYNAHVNVPDSNAPERVLSVSGEFENIKHVVREVVTKISDERTNKVGEVEYEIRILIHQSHAGAIIGKGGAKIKDLRETSGAQLKVFATCAPNSTDRVVLIAGSVEQIGHALQGIHTLLEDIPAKGPIKPYDSLNYDPSYANDYGGLIQMSPMGGMGGPPMGGAMRGGGRFGGGMPPRGGSMMGGGMQRGGEPSYYDEQSMHGGGSGPPSRGPPAAMGARGGHPGYMPPPQGGDFGGYPSANMSYDSGPPMYGGGAPPMGPPQGGAQGGPAATTQVTIPNDLAGTVIGRGGDRISSIRSDSGAHILVEPPQPGVCERIITITGTQAQIQLAQYLLQQCVRTSAAGRRYIDQQQGGGGAAPPPAATAQVPAAQFRR